jgi:hypothetical protein
MSRKSLDRREGPSFCALAPSLYGFCTIINEGANERNKTEQEDEEQSCVVSPHIP